MATLIGTNSNNSLAGTTAADTMIGRAGNDQLVGNGGNDRLNGGLNNDLLNGGLGIDTADYSNIIIGGTTYVGATAGVTVNLNIASAQLTGGAGSDTLVNIENLIGTNFNDTLTGNGVNNVLSGLSGNDILTGNAGNDIVAGVAGTDQLFGGTGNDLLNGGTQNDVLNGGLGSDTADYGTFSIGGQNLIGATAGVTVNLNVQGVAQNTRGAGIDTLASIENLTGSIYSDTLTGNTLDNKLTGREGNDALLGGLGNDTLQGDSGNDTLDGGEGIDTISYTTATAGVTVDLNINGAQNTGGAGLDTLVEIENVIGSKFNDTLKGWDFVVNTLNGRAGNDTLVGFYGTLNGDEGDDELSGIDGGGTLNGGDGNDELFAVDGAYTFNGGAGNDSLLSWSCNGTLNGGDGDDRLENSLGEVTLNGGAGNDVLITDSSDSFNFVTMTGGTGADTFQYVEGQPLDNTVITDFNGLGVAVGDRIDLSWRDANETVDGNQTFIFGGPFTAGHLRYVGGVLQGNTDADAAAEFEIQLVGAPALFVNPASAGADILL